jgi:hypothetical protein
MRVTTFELCKGEEFKIGLRSCSVGPLGIQKRNGLGMVPCIHRLKWIARLEVGRLRT